MYKFVNKNILTILKDLHHKMVHIYLKKIYARVQQNYTHDPYRIPYNSIQENYLTIFKDHNYKTNEFVSGENRPPARLRSAFAPYSRGSKTNTVVRSNPVSASRAASLT